MDPDAQRAKLGQNPGTHERANVLEPRSSALVKVLRGLLGIVATVLFFVGVSAAYFSAPIHHPGEGRFSVLAAVSLLHDGDFDLCEFREPVLYGTPREVLREGPGAIRAAQPPGAALVALPFIALAERSLSQRAARIAQVHEFVARHNDGVALEAIPNRIKTEAIRPFLDRAIAVLIAGGAATALLWLAAARVGWFAALLTALCLAFGTSLLPSLSQSLWSQGPALLALALGMLCLERGRKRKSWVGLAGLPLGFAWISGPELLPVLGVLLLYVGVHERAQTLRLIGWSLPVVVPFLLDSWLRDGVLLPSSFMPSRALTDSYFEELAGHWISPSRGLLVFSPFLLLGIAAIGRQARTWRAPLDLWALLAALGTSALVACDRGAWLGHGFGARAMAPVLALLTLPLAAAVRTALTALRTGRPWLFLALLGSAGFAILVHTNAVLAPAAWEWNVTPQPIDSDPSRLWDQNDPQVLAFLLR